MRLHAEPLGEQVPALTAYALIAFAAEGLCVSRNKIGKAQQFFQRLATRAANTEYAERLELRINNNLG